MGFKNYFIKKGNHRSGFFLNLYLKMFKTKHQVIFSQNCIYKFGDVDDLDINKLFGISFGFHHKNSMRFGWNVDGDKIAIHYYYYKLGKRFMNKMVSIPVETVHTFEITVYDAYYELKVSDTNGKTIGWANIVKPKTVKWGYRLFPYFGGNRVAPHDVTIKMKRIY
jgi:predicted transcriptional regulator